MHSGPPLPAARRGARPAMPGSDRLLAAGLAGLAIAVRIPFRAERLPTWDAVQFALALRDYDLVRHQPHPPGYPLYVAAGRALLALTGDPVAALTGLALLAAGAAVAALYWLGWMVAGRPLALLAAVGLAGSPLLAFHAVVPLPYAVEGALATAVAALLWPLGRGDARLAPWAVLALAAAGGVRPSLLLLLFPLWLLAARAGLGGWRPVVGALGVLALATAAWFGPMLLLAGGPARYLATARELYGSTVRATTVWGEPGGWLGNIRGLLEATVLGLGAFLLAFPRVLRGLRRGPGPPGTARFLLAWTLPPLAVYGLVHFGQSGYLLTVLPALYLLLARGLLAGSTGPAARRLGGVPVRPLAAVAAVALLHTAAFAAAGPLDVDPERPRPSLAERAAGALAEAYRFRLWPHTARGLREQEGVIAAYATRVRQAFDPRDTVLVTELGNPRAYPWFRHATYYLPEFPVLHLRLGPFSRGYLAAPPLTTMAAVDAREIVLPGGTRRLVWIVDFWNPAQPRPPGLRPVPLPHGRWLYVLDLDGRPVAYAGYRLTPAPAAAGAARPG